MEDGYYAWRLANREGYLDSWFLKEVARLLDELNFEWGIELKVALSSREL